MALPPQLLQALGLGGGLGAPLQASMLAQAPPPAGVGGMPGAPGGVMSGAPMGQPPPTNGMTGDAGPPVPPPTQPGPTSQMMGQTGTLGSPPGGMANPAGMQEPQAGASNAPKAANPQEPTGESPNQQPPQNALPHFPRNRFGAMLLPQGGQVGGSMGAPPSPSGAFDWQKILGQFLQRRNAGGGVGGFGGGAPFGQGSPGAPQAGPPTVSGM